MLWSSQLLSAIGDQFYSVALVWMAIEFVGSAAGILISAGSLTTLLCSLLGGILADRWNRRWTLVGTDIIRALAVGLLPLLLLYAGKSGQASFWILMGVTISVEAAGSLFDPALQASLPSFAGDLKALSATNALMNATQRLARLLGPGLTGFILLVIPLPHLFTLDAFTFGISACALFLLGSRFVAKPAAKAESAVVRWNLGSDLVQMFGLLKQHRRLMWALLSLGLSNIAWSAVFMVGGPLLVSTVLKGDAGAYGLLVSVYGVGSILSLFAVGGSNRHYTLHAMYIGQVILSLGFLLLSFAPMLTIAMCGALIAAFGSPMADLILLKMIQTEFPLEHIGKVYSVRMQISIAGLALGQLLSVPLFHLLALRDAMALCSCLILLIGITGVSLHKLSSAPK
ncbi:MAG: MFS transporter [Ktedonobacteraceae bacterium]|nr:MFS transporter [Ktedonobacteraceae bacterium]